MAACSYSPIMLIFPSYAATPNPLSSNTNYLYPVLIHRDRFLPFNIGHNREGQNWDKSFLATSSFAFFILQYRFLGCIMVSFWGRKQVANTGCNTELDRPYNVSDWRKKVFAITIKGLPLCESSRRRKQGLANKLKSCNPISAFACLESPQMLNWSSTVFCIFRLRTMN